MTRQFSTQQPSGGQTVAGNRRADEALGRTQRQIVLDAMRRRPDDPWPRGDGHVLLGEPGGPRSQKAYHEPGGSFSPSPGSFGVSFWVVGKDGRRITTSDEIEIDKISQQFDWTRDHGLPDLVTHTGFYRCRWSYVSEGRWELHLHPLDTCDGTVDVVIRSVGPAGGPIARMDWDGRKLLVDHRWTVIPGRERQAVFLGRENDNAWTESESARETVVDEAGWCYARFRLRGNSDFELAIEDTQPQFASPLSHSGARPMVSCDLPDARFEASLRAQAAHLMMGYVGRQTCPGEPTNYPLAWERDGAYSVMAMACCGQLETARELSVYFAENDFFGGFGAEGDAPGSQIALLVEVASLLNDAQYDAWIWPHVQRKVRTILDMRQANGPLTRPWVGPVLPGTKEPSVICKAARAGVIVGSMDHHYPILYINAVSYRGMVQAARLAERLGEKRKAEEYLRAASELRQGWLRTFETDEAANERTYMSGIWPSWTVGASFAPYVDALSRRSFGRDESLEKRPLWTYFTVAEAHQWLFIGKIEPVWRTLEYFWANQCSPGLYTYWEGDGEENTFNLWPRYRGWVRPPCVTPHYWTASEMLLLQLDMLAYVDESGEEPVLVVGGGAPADWMGSPMRAEGLHTRLGRVDWRYDDGEMTVDLRGPGRYAVRLGPAFPENTRLRVNRC